MAGTDDNAAGGNGNLLDAVKPLVNELRIAFEAVSAGLLSLAARPEATFIKDELGMLARMLAQGAESMDALEAIFGEGDQ